MFPKGSTLSFKDFVAKKNLEEKGHPFSDLARLPESDQVALAFDGNKISEDICEETQRTCPLAAFTVSNPISLYNTTERYAGLIKAMEDKLGESGTSFKAVVTFNGCGFAPLEDLDTTAPPTPSELLRCKAFSRQTTVTSVPENVVRKYATRYQVDDDAEVYVIRQLRKSTPDVFSAPYLAWSQIAAFMAPSNNFVSEVYGCLELLAFPGIKRVITDINLEKGTFNCVTKNACIAALEESFGSPFSESDFAAVVLCSSKQKKFRIKSKGELFEELCKLPVNPSRYDQMLNDERNNEELIIHFQRNMAALSAPVMTKDGTLTLLSLMYGSTEYGPTRTFFGAPMPPLFYLLQMTGPMLPEMFAAHGTRVLYDDWPIIDTAAFRRASEFFLPLRAQVNFQISQLMKSYVPVEWLRQYVVLKGGDANTMPRRRSPILSPPNIVLANWDVGTVNTPQSLVQEGTVYIGEVLDLCGCAITEPVRCDTIEKTLASVYLRSLDLLGYFTHAMETQVESSGPSLFCKALYEFKCPTLSAYGVLLIELIRTRTLHDDPLLLQVGSADVSAMEPGVRFASRVASIVPLNVYGAWTGPFDPEMAAFGVMTRMIGRTLRSLHEVVAALMVITGSTTIPADRFNEIIDCLPFDFPIEFSAGFLMNYILCNKDCTIDELREVFPELAYLESDLEGVFWFYSMAHAAIYVMCSEERHSYEDIATYNTAFEIVSEACKRLCPSYWELNFRKWINSPIVYTPTPPPEPTPEQQQQMMDQQQYMAPQGGMMNPNMMDMNCGQPNMNHMNPMGMAPPQQMQQNMPNQQMYPHMQQQQHHQMQHQQYMPQQDPQQQQQQRMQHYRR